MALVINTNVQSLNSQRQLNKSSMETSQAMERLSSGKQINSAKDDAAGLVISNRMTSQIRGLDRAVANANDGVSLIQTAEGAMEETTNILQRMRELSIQSANGIYNDGDRATLDAEVQQLVAELDRIAETTSFNGQNLLDGTLGKVDLQVGSEANQTISLTVEAMDAKTLGMGSTSVDLLGGQNSLVADNTALSNNDIMINGQSIMGIGETWTGGTDDMDELIEKINTNVNGISASTVATTTAETVGTGVLGEGDELTVTIGKLDGTTAAVTITDTESLQEVADKLNSEGGGLISASLNDNGKLVITSEEAESLTMTDVTAATGTLATATASIILKADNGDPVEVTRGASGTLGDLDSFGFRENDVAGEVEGSVVDGNAFALGDLSVNGVKVGASDSGGLQDKVNAINAVTDESGVTAAAFSSATIDFDGVDIATDIQAADEINLNGTALDFGAVTDVASIVAVFNADSDSTGVTASQLGTRVVLEGDVASLTFTNTDTGTDDLAAWETAGAELVSGSGDTVTALTATTVVAGGIRLESDNGNPISVEHAPNGTAAEKIAAEAKSGLVDSNALSGGSFGSSISTISIATQSGAQKAIDVIDNAINTVSSNRADLGAVNNRLDFTISNLSNISEKTSSARSSIVDADFAAETANLSRAQVLQQASQAMLAQANAAPQQVLSLLR